MSVRAATAPLGPKPIHRRKRICTGGSSYHRGCAVWRSRKLTRRTGNKCGAGEASIVRSCPLLVRRSCRPPLSNDSAQSVLGKNGTTEQRLPPCGEVPQLRQEPQRHQQRAGRYTAETCSLTTRSPSNRSRTRKRPLHRKPWLLRVCHAYKLLQFAEMDRRPRQPRQLTGENVSSEHCER